MHQLDGRLIFAATDLSNFLACPHLTLLSRRTALGGPKPRHFPDPGLEVVQQRGMEHEQVFSPGCAATADGTSSTSPAQR